MTHDQKKNLALLKIANKSLTNYFTGKTMSNLKNIVSDKFQFGITNANTGASGSRQVAIATGNIPTLGVDYASNACTVHYHNNAILAKEYGPNIVVLDDATVDGVTMSHSMSDQSIAHSKHYLLHNEKFIRRITITSNKEEQFSSSMTIGSCSPFHKENTRSIDLNQFMSVSQYNTKKVEIDFAQDEVPWNDELFLSLHVVPDSSCQVTVWFF